MVIGEEIVRYGHISSSTLRQGVLNVTTDGGLVLFC
jgi:hypothetical protein